MTVKKKVVVTGLGLATPLGLDVEENWEKVLAGESGISRLAYPGAEKSPVQAVGEIKEENWNKIKEEFKEYVSCEGERRTLFGLWTAKSALNDAGVNQDKKYSNRFGVAFAAGLGITRLEDVQNFMNKKGEFDCDQFSKKYKNAHKESIVKNNSNRAASLIAQKFSLKGANYTITSACASATQAVGIAYKTIQRGDADLMVAGGADSMINPMGLVFFVLLQAACVSSSNSHGLCRPFDRKRSGLVMGEGAGTAILEEESHALKRGAKIYAEVAGYGSSMDAFQVTAPHPKGNGAEQSMNAALKDAHMKIDEIDYINAHGTSTKLNDSTETLAIKKVFKENANGISISSSKSLIGHFIAASGGPEFVFTVLSVERDQIHPTINITNPDPKCDLDYVSSGKRKRPVRAAISNSFGFGGQNATIVVKKYRA